MNQNLESVQGRFSMYINDFCSFTYTIKGNTANDEFDNVNPDEVNAKLNAITPNEKQIDSMDKEVMITELDKIAEYIVI